MPHDITNNIIINYLPQFMGDDEFRNMFLSIGPLKSAKIMRDKSSGFSYGFGFVEYQVDRDADRAVKTFDGLHMYSKRIRVQHANKADEPTKGFNLYVKNIPSEYTETELDKLFEPFGKIVTSKVLVDLQTGQSRNVGFVLYETKAEADKAIGELNGKPIEGSSTPLYLKFADDGSKKSKSNAPMLPQVSPSQHFTAPFPPPGPQGNGFTPPTPPGPMRNQNSSRGFRFNPLSRDNIGGGMGNMGGGMGNMGGGMGGSPNTNLGNPGGFGGQNFNQPNFGSNTNLSSGMSSPHLDIPSGPGPYSIFVFNIGDDAEDRELWALFSPFGSVQKCTVMMDSEKRICKGYGFVDMTNAGEAATAIQGLNGTLYKGRQLNVSFKSKKKE